MASFSTHPFCIALNEAMRSVAAVHLGVNDAALSSEDAAPWRSRLRTLDGDALNILEKLYDIEDEFVQSKRKE